MIESYFDRKGENVRRRIILHPQKKTIDLPLLLTVVILVLFGLTFVYDVSAIQAFRDFGDSAYYIKNQLIWVIIGIASAYFFTYFDYQKLRKISAPLFILSIIALLAVFIPGLGTRSGGAQRWLNLSFFSVQPIEILKLTSVIFFATQFDKKLNLKLLLLVIFAASFIVGFLQRDLGSTIVFVTTSLLIYIIAGGSLWQFAISVPILLGALIILVITSEYRRKRIFAFLDPSSDPQGYTYHIYQILVSLGSGGIFGLGLGQSRQKFYIPEVTTDSIFAIIGEELGIVGGILILSLFAYFVIRGFKIAANAQDNFGKILASGITSWIGIQAIINLGAMVSLFPLTGVPLPFISYGGSALVANLTAVGILLNISKRK